jgi:isoamylase
MPQLLPGGSHTLGSTWDGQGVNFAVFAENAEKVELCLFDGPDSAQASQTLALPEKNNGVWHGYFPGLKPGQLYGYRAHGPYEPGKGLRFNPAKILLDPYAKGIGRDLKWADEVFGYGVGNPEEDLSRDERDSAAFAPLACVMDESFDWGGDRKPAHPWNKTLIYELHVKGFTKLHPGVPENLRGTYAGLASEPAIAHLKSLGVTAVELQPIHYFLQDRHLLEKGLRNYWGYNTLGFFAPNPGYAAARDPAGVLREFKEMVRSLHAAGIEVILDVVYNHTAEGNQMGPTLSFRGLDNLAYYHTVQDQSRYYADFAGCGNTLNTGHPRVLQLVMDSLRYWMQEMHVDGFRFDLAPALARELHSVNKLGSFFETVLQDPVLSRAKLIAEPWDLGEGGYLVGNFPPGWAEWNGIYRDSIRRFWKGDGGTASELATRITGSSDLYESSGRRPFASVNFVTAHDGFTLNDLVSYNEKHNEQNLDGDGGGENNNNSWNCGHEGPDAPPEVLALRERQKRNILATLLLSQGVPMLLLGDEAGRTQQGNNNGYCQDNELTWMHWDWSPAQKDLVEFTRAVSALWSSNPVFQRRNFFQGRPIRGKGVKDILWLAPSGEEMDDETWNSTGPCLGMALNGEAIEEMDLQGNRILGKSFLLFFNAGQDAVPFTMPPPAAGGWSWTRVIDTARDKPLEEGAHSDPAYNVEGRSVVVLRMDRKE